DPRHPLLNNAISAENQRYENAKAAAASRDNTKFIFWLDRDSKNNPLYLDTGTGPSSGVAEFQALGGSDYYFIVEAAGPWTVTVYFKP
ncbi:MAG: hypothetical protein HW378_1992, partial [Anaerolineales bacterium]|nr:hypothetical protein [Anaerolineales bacterium]